MAAAGDVGGVQRGKGKRVISVFSYQFPVISFQLPVFYELKTHLANLVVRENTIIAYRDTEFNSG